jgi:hypothetical protein
MLALVVLLELYVDRQRENETPYYRNYAVYHLLTDLTNCVILYHIIIYRYTELPTPRADRIYSGEQDKG